MLKIYTISSKLYNDFFFHLSLLKWIEGNAGLLYPSKLVFILLSGVIDKSCCIKFNFCICHSSLGLDDIIYLNPVFVDH